MKNETKRLTPEEVNQTATAHFGTNTLKWLEESANGFARAIEDKLIEKNTPGLHELYEFQEATGFDTAAEFKAAKPGAAHGEIVAKRFEAMSERGDAWVTTRAAATIARNPYVTVTRIKECEHDWTEESRANWWRSSCRLCGKKAAGSGQ